MPPEILIVLISSVTTAVIGPIAVQLVKNRLEKKPDIFHKELQLSNVIQDKLLGIQQEYNVDRVWITQFHNGGHFYPTGKSIQKFSMVYEITGPHGNSIQTNFQNIPINLFSKSINHIMEEDVMSVPDFKDESLPSYGLKYLAQETGCKSAYGFSLKTIDGKFIGILGLDYAKHKKLLSDDELNEIQIIATAIGALLGDTLK